MLREVAPQVKAFALALKLYKKGELSHKKFKKARKKFEKWQFKEKERRIAAVREALLRSNGKVSGSMPSFP